MQWGQFVLSFLNEWGFSYLLCNCLFLAQSPFPSFLEKKSMQYRRNYRRCRRQIKSLWRKRKRMSLSCHLTDSLIASDMDRVRSWSLKLKLRAALSSKTVKLSGTF